MFANALAGGQYYVDNQKIRQTGIADFFIVHDTAKNKWVVCWTQDVINQMFTDYL
jgi:hypothetical protein